MNKRTFVAAVVLVAATAVAAAQSPNPQQTPPQPRPTPEMPAVTAEQPTTTLVGCLYREDQVPGRTPNVAERAGILEDYILADATIASAKSTPGTTPEATGGTPPAGKMYKVEKIPDDRLKTLVGKKVQVTGRIDPGGSAKAPTGTPQPDRGPGPDDIELPEFEATSIQEVPGSCPATPARRQ